MSAFNEPTGAAREPDLDLSRRIERAFEIIQERERRVAEFLQSQRQAKPCPKHPNILRAISLERTRQATHRNFGRLTPGYEHCPLCASGERQTMSAPAQAPVRVNAASRRQAARDNYFAATE